MRKLAVICTLIVVCFVVDIHDSSAEELIYSEVIQVPGVKKNDLYLRARDWFLKTYYKGASVMKIQDPDNGELVGNAIIKHKESHVFNPNQCAEGNIYYTIHVWVKDGRFKYDISDFYHVSHCANVNPEWNIRTFFKIDPEKPDKESRTDKVKRENYKRVKGQVVIEIESLILSLKNFMNESTNKNSDW